MLLMDQDSWQLVDQRLGQIAEKFDKLLESAEFQDIREILSQLSQSLDGRFVVNLNCNVDIFDHLRERSLPLFSTTVSVAKNREVNRTWNGSTHQRYLVGDAISVVPHDHCPKCWAEWNFKFKNRSCQHCDAELGTNCKLLLDSEVCPNCEAGEISESNPHCDNCGFTIDPAVVVWG